MKKIEVAAAAIFHEGRVLAAQRGYGELKDGWEFPGGKLEPGESPEQALVRELREEMDVTVSVEEKLGMVEYDYPAFHVRLHLFAASVTEGKIVLLEHEGARWVDENTIGELSWLPADLDLLPAVVKRLKKI